MNNKTLIVLFLAIIILLGGIFFLVIRQRPHTSTSTPVAQFEPTPTSISFNEASITLNASGFSPRTVTIKAGEGVRWFNKLGAKASINSADHPTHRKFPEMNLGEFSNNTSLSVIIKKPGTYYYHNHYNPSQSGSIIVE